MQAQRQQVESHEVTTITETVNAFDGSSWPYRITTDAGTVVHALSVIVATGSSPRKLGVPGEDRFWGNGVSTCALCDGPLYKNKSVVVVGGGDSAVEETVQLAGLVGNVTMLVRGDRLRASDAMQKKLTDVANIVVRYGCQLRSIVGTDDGVTGVEVYDVHTQKTETLATQAVFLAIGHEPRTQLFNGVLELTSDNYIQVAANDRTVNGRTANSQAASLPGVFAAGDVAAYDAAKAHFRQAGIALGEGQKAAKEAYLFLQERGLTTPILKSLRSGSLGVQFYRRAPVH
jgi:thioredoxin reductase (NADPH)